MARYNEILVGRVARGVQKLFGVKGEVPVASLAGELQIVHALSSGVENKYLEGWDRFGSATTVAAAGVGNQGGLRYRNPVGSGALVVFEKISITNLAGLADNVTLQIGSGIADLATPVSIGSARLDSRGRQSTALVITTGIATSTGSSIERGRFPANQTYDFILTHNQEITLLPGDTLCLINGTTNQAWDTTQVWRERFLEDSERQ